MWLRTLGGDLLNLRFASSLHFSPTAIALRYEGEGGGQEAYPWTYDDEAESVQAGALEHPSSFEDWCREQIRAHAGLLDLVAYRTRAGETYGEAQAAEDEETSEWAEALTLRLEASRERRSGEHHRAAESWMALSTHTMFSLDTITTIYISENGSVMAASAGGAETALLSADSDDVDPAEAEAWAGAMLDWIADRLKERAPLIDLAEFTAEIIMGEEPGG